jgi:hypothetical protein
VILALAVGKLRNVEVFVRTLRTTGCRARCVLFVDAKAITGEPPEFFATLFDCGVQLVNLGNDPAARLGTDFLRQFVYHRFVVTNLEYIHRVLAVDLFDTFFQKDPFIARFQADRVYYSDEGYAITNDNCNREWINKTLPRVGEMFGVQNVTEGMAKKVFSYTIVNSGLIGGGVALFLQHLDLMLKMGDFVTWTPYCADQPFLELALSLGFMRFPHQIDPPNSTFLGTVGILVSRYPDSMGKEMGSFTRDGGIPNVVHQFNRSPFMSNASQEACLRSLS